MKINNKKNNAVKNLKDKIFEDFKIKIICFILAIALYFLSSIYFYRSTHTYSCKLKVENLKNYFIIKNQLPDTIKVIATDKPGSFNKINEDDFKIRLNLENVDRPDIYKIKLNWDIPDNMRSLFGYISCEPEVITVEIDKLMEKNVKIDLNVIGTPAPGYAVKKITIDPTYVRIQGPETIVSNINSVKTELINIDNIKEFYIRKVDLVSEYSMLKIFGKADIVIEIKEETEYITFRYQNIVFINLAKQFKAKTTEDFLITLKGPKNELTNLKMSDILVYIDCASIKFPGEYSYEVNVKIPEQYVILSKIPTNIKIIVEDK